METGGMKRDGSSGLLDLFEGDHRRREGSSMIARQIELENMKVRQYRAKEKVNETHSSLRQEKQMNQYLEQINREHHSVEQWQNNYKKQQMRENIAESLRLREETDTELALGLVNKEASMNTRSKMSPAKPMNTMNTTITKENLSNLLKQHNEN